MRTPLPAEWEMCLERVAHVNTLEPSPFTECLHRLSHPRPATQASSYFTAGGNTSEKLGGRGRVKTPLLCIYTRSLLWASPRLTPACPSACSEVAALGSSGI